MKKSQFLFFLAVVLSFFAWQTLLKPGYFSMHDDMQAFRLLEMDKCFRDSQLPCRWVPDAGFGYGYPLFNYYPPLPYYLAQLIHSLGFSILDSIKAVFILGFLIAAGTMYLLGQSLWGPWGGFLASILYSFAPYHAVDIYARGALNEFWAFAWFPAVFFSIYRYIETEKKKYLLGFALFYALLFLTHNLMVLIFTPVAIGWLVLNLLSFKKVRLWSRFIGSSLLSLGLAAFFVFPVVLEKKLVHLETMIVGYFNYLAHFVSLNQLFLRRNWGYDASVWGMEEDLSFQIGWPHWWLAFLVIPLAFFLPKNKEDEKKRRLIFYFLIFGLTAAFLTHPRSTFLWKKLPFLEYLQFPWRFLSLVIFSFSLLAGALPFILKRIIQNQKRSRNNSKVSEFKTVSDQQGRIFISFVTLALAASAILLNAPYFKEDIWYWHLTDSQRFSDPGQWERQITSGIFDYLPKSAPFPPGEAALKSPWFESGEGEIINYQRGTNWYRFQVRVVSDEAVIKIPTFDFPDWELKVDQEVRSFEADKELGRPFFYLSQGEYRVSFELKNTPIRVFSNWLSLISWLGFFWLAFKYSSAEKAE
ncbi:MAG: glycosyltransferase family 39 protein [Candidatus Pacebacteria bacterium]|nr:glycosyltransferase family 39 protein [Candidatus Paceibacterota bacterium]